jgi:hypothetical protein
MIEFILYVSDQNISKKFYSEILEKKPVLDVPGMTEFELSENCKLGLMPNDSIAKILGDMVLHPDLGKNVPRCELYLYPEDINNRFIKAVRSGAKEISSISIRNWGDKVGYLSDPDGHIIAFAEKIAHK